jgi:hypothetical protein
LPINVVGLVQRVKSCVEVQLGWRAINAFPLNPPTAIVVFVVKVYENRIQTQNKEKGKG